MLFALAAGCLFGILFTFGRTSIWYIDGLGQYYPSFLYTGSYIRSFFLGLFHGRFKFPRFDLSIGMGEDIIGCLNYYGFGNPINLLAAFADQNNGGLVFTISHLIRLYLAGFSALIYLKKMGYAGSEASVGALAYAFCGFALYGGFMYIEFLSVLFYFPLMLTGAESLFHRGIRFKNALLFIFSVFYGALCGFYFLYMATLALFVYCLVRLYFIQNQRFLPESGEKADKINIKSPEKSSDDNTAELKHVSGEATKTDINTNKHSYINGKTVLGILTEGIKLLCFYVIGILLSSPVLIPVLRSFFNSERNPHTIDILSSRSNYLPRPRLLLEFLRNSVVPGKSFAFGVLFIEWIAVIMLFFMPRTKRRLQLKIGVIISLIAVSLPITGYLFNGFSENYDRWLFLVHFLFMIVFVHMIMELRGRIPYSIDNISEEEKAEPYHKEASIKNYKLTIKEKDISGTIVSRCFMGILVLNIVFNIFGLFSGLGLDWQQEFVKSEGLSVYTSSPVSASKTITEDKGFFRVSNDSLTGVNERPENVAMLNDYYGLTYWFSIINDNTQKYVDENNGKELIWRSYGFNNNIYTEGLAGCKYYLADTLSSDNSYEYVETVSFNGRDWYVYKNPYYLGMVYYSGSNDEYEKVKDLMTLEEYNRQFYENASREEPINASYDNKKNVLSFETAHKENAEVIVAIPYSSRWRAYLDGEEVPVSIFNMYTKISVPSGSHNIVMLYK